MRRVSMLLAAVALTVFAAGCTTTIPTKIAVKDVASGRTYQTYQPWGSVNKGVGYAFPDLESGSRITLTSYEIKTIEGQKSVPSDSVEAKDFIAAKARSGIK